MSLAPELGLVEESNAQIVSLTDINARQLAEGGPIEVWHADDVPTEIRFRAAQIALEDCGTDWQRRVAWQGVLSHIIGPSDEF